MRDMLELKSHFSELFTVSSKRCVHFIGTIHHIKSNQFIEYAVSYNLYYRQPCKMSGFYPLSNQRLELLPSLQGYVLLFLYRHLTLA